MIPPPCHFVKLIILNVELFEHPFEDFKGSNLVRNEITREKMLVLDMNLKLLPTDIIS